MQIWSRAQTIAHTAVSCVLPACIPDCETADIDAFPHRERSTVAGTSLVHEMSSMEG